MTKILEAVKKMVEMIAKMIAAFFKMIGLGGGNSAARMGPRAPTKAEAQAARGGGDGPGMKPVMAPGMSPAQKILAFASAAKEERAKLDLSGLSHVQEAWLRGADEKTLEQMAKMDPKEAVAFFLQETSKAKKAMLKPAKDEVVVEKSETTPDSDVVPVQAGRRPKRIRKPEPAPRGPRFAMAM